jgi:hypothetical protein
MANDVQLKSLITPGNPQGLHSNAQVQGPEIEKKIGDGGFKQFYISLLAEDEMTVVT